MIDISKDRRFPLFRDRCARILEQIDGMEQKTGTMCSEWEITDEDTLEILCGLCARLSEIVQ